MAGRRQPVYAELVADLRHAIHTGRLAPGARLPSEAELRERYGISRVSVRQGLALLGQEGLVHPEAGRGTFATACTTLPARRICLLLPYPGEALCARIVAGVSRAATGLGWEVTLCSSCDDPGLERAAIARSVVRRDSGLIVLPIDPRDTPDGLSQLAGSGVTTVFVDRAVPGFDWDVVESDHQVGAEIATKRLLQAGHRDLAFLTTDNLTVRSVAKRLIGFRAALAEAGIPFLPQRLWFARSPMRAEEREAIRQALLVPDRPTGVFAMNDLLAAELVRLAEGEGIAVPGDLSIVGFDGLERTTLVSQLTTVRQPAEEVGTMAVRILAERLAGKRTGPGQTTTLRVELLEGATVAPPRPAREPRRSVGTSTAHGSGAVGSLRPLPFHE